MQQFDRRKFIKSGVVVTAGTAVISMLPNTGNARQSFSDQRPNVIGPRDGFSTEVGTLLSMMTWMRGAVLSSVKDLTIKQLDHLHDHNSNTIASMLLHLAATERFYQVHTFEGKKWGDWNDRDKRRFETAMALGDKARNSIKGNNLDFYLSTLKEVREKTISEFKKRDDKWLFSVDEQWPWGPTNNYCKWFHVCEHESNHNGQIKYIKGRIPGTKPGKD